MLRISSLAVPLLLLLGSSVWAQSTAASAVKGAPAVQVFEGTAIPAGSGGIQAHVGRVDFGSAAIGKMVTKTFTIKNAGATGVTLSDFIKLPQGFTLVKRLGTTKLSPGQSTTFIMALNSAWPGRLGGDLGMQSGDGKTNLFTFTVTGTALAPPSMRIITRNDAGFRTVGTWSPVANVTPYGNTQFTAPGKGTNLATWTFTGLQPGRYVVSVTWPSNPNAASNAQYTVLDGTKAFRPVTVNQKSTPAGLSDAGTTWAVLGEPYQINDGSLVVQLSDRADGYVLADAVRIERVWFPGQIITQGARGFSTTGNWAKAKGTGVAGEVVRAVAEGASATWTFTGLKRGEYRVSATWPEGSSGAADATYTILDGGKVLGRVQIDQRQAARDLADAGVRWKDLGELGTLYKVTGDTLVVRLTGRGLLTLVADAVRIERMSGPGTAASEPDIIRFLEQCTFGPTEALIAHIRDDLGGDLYQFLLEQGSASTMSGYPSLPLYADNIDETRAPPERSCVGLTGQARTDCNREKYTIFPLQRQFFLNALYADDQLRQRLAWALHKIVVVSGRDIPRPYRYTPYLQVFDQNAFGNYKDVLLQITLNYPMGVYLNMDTSTATNPNENYAREILQLFSIGLFVLNPDGTPTTSPPTPTYGQDEITNFARLFTGWQRAPDRPEFPFSQNYLDPMVPRAPNQHDQSAKTLLRGQMIPGGQDAPTDFLAGIDNIWNDPTLAPFMSKSLIQQFVTSNPSPAYVARVTSGFNVYRNEPNQLWALMIYILLDPEARGDVITNPNYGKLREPALFACNLLRAFPAISYDEMSSSDGVVSIGAFTAMDQDVLRPLTVFSYFLPGYTIPGSGGLLGPEFEILSTVDSTKRVNWLNQLVNPNGGAASYGIPTDVNNGRPRGTRPRLTELLNRAMADPTGGQVADYLNRLLLHGTMTSQMRTDLLTAITAVPANNPLRRAKTALYLIGSSSQYQVQR